MSLMRLQDSGCLTLKAAQLPNMMMKMMGILKLKLNKQSHMIGDNTSKDFRIVQPEVLDVNTENGIEDKILKAKQSQQKLIRKHHFI